ncbi:MAG: ABC transporter permease [Planctomycetota bacterium]
MHKIFTIAVREYQAMVATKAFAVAIALMPVLMLGGAWLPGLLQGMETPAPRTIAVLDRTGQLFPLLRHRADERNRTLEQNRVRRNPTTAPPESSVAPTAARTDDEDERAKRALGLEEIHPYLLEEIPVEGFSDERRLAFSDRIRVGQLYAFVEIPSEVLQPRPLTPEDAANPSIELLRLPGMRWVAQDAALSDARRWAETALNQIIRAQRLSASVEQNALPTVLLELERKSALESAGLYYRDESGRIVSEDKPNELTSLMLPMGIMMLMFMVIMMAAQPMLESVLEEKTLRIAEVLLGSANARQLMTGKLLGNVAGSLTVFVLYGGGGAVAAVWQGHADSVPWHVLPWFIVFQILAVMLYSSIFMAIAASVTQLREAQSLLLPVWMVVMMPLFVWFNVVREPNSTMATVISFFPPSTPMVMTMRMATGATIPWWQSGLSMLLMIAATAAGVLLAARIYRVGILRQGKAPRFTEMLKWAFQRNQV